MNAPAQQQAITGEIMPQPLAVYDPFRAQIAELRTANEKTFFNYADPKGNKEARSYIYRLRQSRSALEKARKDEKAASLEYGRKVDTEAKELMAELDAMIAVHQKPLEEIEEKERQRVERIHARIQGIAKYRECAGHSSDEIKAAIAELEATVIDEAFAEFHVQAEEALIAALGAQRAEMPVALKREADAAEFARLQQEEAARKQAEHEKRIADEAAAKAKAEAEAKAKQQADEAEKRRLTEQQAREEAEKRAAQAEADAKAAAARAEEEARRREEEAAAAERKRIADEQAAAAAEQAKREANTRHRTEVEKKAKDAIFAILAGDQDDIAVLAHEIVKAISAGEIPHATITY